LQALLLLHLLSSAVVVRFGAASLLVVALLARVLMESVDLPVVLALPCRFGVFYALGVVFGPVLAQWVAAWRRTQALGLAFAAAAVWVLAASAAEAAGAGYWSVAALPAALAGSIAALALSLWPRGATMQLLCLLGRNSMAIFLLHVLFVAGTRIALNKWLGMDEPALILSLALLAGIGGPLLVRALAVRAHLGRALGLG
jgi:hypothetical protein